MNVYFAYGSNMDELQMRERCPDAKLVGQASLPGFQLAFTIFSQKRKSGCADIVRDKKSTVYGLAYELTDADLEALDRFEGAPDNYERIAVKIKCNGLSMRAYAYHVASKVEGFFPSPAYIDTILKNAEKHGFPAEYLDSLKATEKFEV